MATASKTGALRTIREDELGRNPVVVETARELLQAKVARLKALQALDQLNEEKASRTVWVPASSSRGSKHGSKLSVEDLDSKLRANKTNARLQAGEVRRLSVKKAFVVWRAMSTVRGVMERELDIIEQEEMTRMARSMLRAWKDAAEPWVYEESVLESAELFRLVGQLGQQDQIVRFWRAHVARRKELEARMEVFQEHVARRMLRDAMIHWKVYRLVYHLKRGREELASQFDRARRLRAVFVHLRDRARKRRCICDRMEAAVFAERRLQPTVDDLLTMGQASIVSKVPYAVFGDHLRTTMDIQAKIVMMQQLKAACNDMRPLVRWKEVAAYSSSDLMSRRALLEDSAADGTDCTRTRETGTERLGSLPEEEGLQRDPMEPVREQLAACCEREDILTHKQQAVLAEMARLSRKKIPRLQKKQEAAMKNLSDCEKVISDLESVRQLLERQWKMAEDDVSKREADLAEAAAITERLEGVHSAALESVNVVKARMLSHMENCRRIDDQISNWQAKVDDHARRMSAVASGERGTRAAHSMRGRDITAAVKLDEARDRLERAEERRRQLDASNDQLVAEQEETMAVERGAKDELSRARDVEGRARSALSDAQIRRGDLEQHRIELERDYHGLLLCLEKLLGAVDRSDAAVTASFERASELDLEYEKLQESLRNVHEEKKSLEQEIEAYAEKLDEEEAVSDQLVPSLHGDAELDDDKEEVMSVTLWGNESRIYHAFGMAARRPKPMIPGDRLLLQAADSYRILSRARSCLTHWRAFTSQKKIARQESERCYIFQVAPRVFAAWQQHVCGQVEHRNAWNDCRILKSALAAWKRVSHKLRRDAFLVESCRAVSAARLQERVLLAWKDVTEEELLCHHTAHCRDIALRAKMFAYWRSETRRSVNLADRLGPVQQKKEHDLIKAAFDDWRVATKQRLALRKVFDRACKAWSARVIVDAYFDPSNRCVVLDDCVNAWSLVVHQAREDRRLAAIEEEIETSRRRRILVMFFNGLKKATEAQRNALDNLLRDADERHRLATLRGAFAYLRSWATHRAVKATHLRVKWSYDHPLRAAILAWQTAIYRRQEMESRKLLCDNLKRVVQGVTPVDCHASLELHDTVESSAPETLSPIKSATYLAADMSLLSFAESAHGESCVATAEHDDVQATAISL